MGTYNDQYKEYDAQGYDQKGYDRPGYDEEGYDRPGYDREGYDRPGYDRPGYDREGYDRPGYDRPGYDREGYDREGHDRQGEYKHVDANPGDSCRGEEGADDFHFHDYGHWTIDNYNGQEGDMLDFTEWGLTREEIASQITNVSIEADTFIINFGNDVSITVIGQAPTWDNVITVEG
ncbi:hypothetical protein [Nitrosomonas communis]|uniref:Uncharacterized protein n=1 Tax=Nitrosomonas communis TaxID=44574 RepID=A0A1I4W233_9PROT|nr:hypothetical protein [Nitrosomonas communis]SFN07532.1 hypothetical protein SAMN05421863_10969 [Nitrosomonas communis]